MTCVQLSTQVDIYSFGIVLWEIVTGERPLRGQTRELRVPEECPPEVDALISRCMAADPAARPSAKDIHEALLAIPYPASTRGAHRACPVPHAHHNDVMLFCNPLLLLNADLQFIPKAQNSLY